VTSPEDFNVVRDELKAKGYEFLSADIKLIINLSINTTRCINL
jgi:transcriptional/translational regulatory protein YebC/TACO1